MQSWSSRSYVQICATVTMHLAVSVAVHVFSSLVYTTCSEGQSVHQSRAKDFLECLLAGLVASAVGSVQVNSVSAWSLQCPCCVP